VRLQDSQHCERECESTLTLSSIPCDTASTLQHSAMSQSELPVPDLYHDRPLPSKSCDMATSASSARTQLAVLALWEELCVPLWHRASFARASTLGNDAFLWENDLHCRVELARLRIMQQSVSSSLTDWYVISIPHHAYTCLFSNHCLAQIMLYY
jgi:hypothetical protein